uniref:Dolichyl-diphosphooligosaccharide--protein glycosyltransferase subunit DAD1 n=1 Tax=Anopheles atroparvus TaxID=41427 RepID=A0AAG5D9W4_ANOAO
VSARERRVLHKFYDEYTHKTPKKLKIVDAYLLYILLTGITQFDQFLGISPERGFADFVFAHIILHLVVFNFIG